MLADVTPDTIAKLKADKCDVAFVNLPIASDPDLQLHGNFMRQNDVFVAGAQFVELKDKQVSISTLQKYPLILMQHDTVARRSLDHFFASHGIELHPSVEVGSWDLMKRFVSRGMGIGVIPREYATQGLADGSMFELQTDVRLPARSVGMLLPRQAPISYALHCFIEQFQKSE